VTPAALGIDVGTTNVKTAVVEGGATLRVAARGEASHPTLRPAPERAEQDPAAWSAALAAALGPIRPALDEVAAVAVCGQGSTFVLVDPGGEALGRAIGWQDLRAAEDAPRLGEDLAPALARANGNRIGDAPEPKLMWLRRQEPQMLSAAASALTAAAYLGARLGARAALNEGDAGSWVSWNRHERSWDENIVQRLELADLLPPVEPLGTVLGGVSPAAGSWTGLPCGTPIVAGTTDVAAAAIAAGVGRAGEAYYSKGTGGFICIHVGPIVDPGPLLALPSGRDGVVQLCGATDTLGAAWDWARELAGGLDHEVAEELGRAVGPGAGGLLLLPWLQGAQHPILAPKARGVALGLSLETGPGALLRAVLEGTSAMLRTQLEVARRQSGERLELVVASGGPTRNDLWNRLDASAAEIPVIVAEKTDAAVGAALIAGEALDLWPDALLAGRELRGEGRRYEPEPELVAQARTCGSLADRLAQAVSPLFSDLSRMRRL
jgi:xylulokinase